MRSPIASLPFVLVLSSMSAALVGQDEAQAPWPDPKVEQHDLLQQLVGTWRVRTKMPAMPGVPGMEKASEMSGIERAELICDGLWLKATGRGEHEGQQAEGIWLLGYDPFAKVYKCVAVSSMEGGAAVLDARFDRDTKTWVFDGSTKMGRMISEFVIQDADHTVETAYGVSEDGEKTRWMTMERTRVKEPKGEAPRAVAEAVAAPDQERPAPAAALLADVGTWNAAFTMEMPGAPAMKAACREEIVPVCGGNWTWSTFSGEMMGAPFVGHSLTGYDPATETVTCFWFDSGNSAFMRTDGEYDAESRTFTMKGSSYGPDGELAPVRSTSVTAEDGTRSFRMVFGEGDAESVMTIQYSRSRE